MCTLSHIQLWCIDQMALYHVGFSGAHWSSASYFPGIFPTTQWSNLESLYSCALAGRLQPLAPPGLPTPYYAQQVKHDFVILGKSKQGSLTHSTFPTLHTPRELQAEIRSWIHEFAQVTWRMVVHQDLHTGLPDFRWLMVEHEHTLQVHIQEVS